MCVCVDRDPSYIFNAKKHFRLFTIFYTPSVVFKNLMLNDCLEKVHRGLYYVRYVLRFRIIDNMLRNILSSPNVLMILVLRFGEHTFLCSLTVCSDDAKYSLM